MVKLVKIKPDEYHRVCTQCHNIIIYKDNDHIWGTMYNGKSGKYIECPNCKNRMPMDVSLGDLAYVLQK